MAGNRVAVVVPTYQRPQMLRACVESLLAAERRPDEIVIAGRKGDQATRDVVRQLQAESAVQIRDTWVTQPGHIPPVRAGASAATADIVAFVDDDVTVTLEWLRYLVSNFDSHLVGVAGGRVVVPGAAAPALKGRPGQIAWYGKHWGNIGSVEAAQPMDVASLMEGNWAWRRELLLSLEFDSLLNFDDASMYGLDLCWQARKKGYRVVYDWRALVYHHAAPRVAELDRADRPRRLYSYARNFTYIQLKHLPGWRKPFFLTWWFLVGETGAWGIGPAIPQWLFNGEQRRCEVRRAFAGKLDGLRLWLNPAQAAAQSERGGRVGRKIE
jgi:GT2 family glycosyltransferase